MKKSIIRDKHLKLSQPKIDKVKRILKTKTESEAIEKALDLVIAEEEIEKTFKKIGGKGRIKRVFT